MKTKASKFWALFTCVAIIFSLGAPIFALASADDDCCDHHNEEGHIHDCSSHLCSHGSEPEADPDNDPDPGLDPCICEDECICEVIVDCDDEDCTCEVIVDCDEEDCTCADCTCEDECICDSLDCLDCDDCNDVPFASMTAKSAMVPFSAGTDDLSISIESVYKSSAAGSVINGTVTNSPGEWGAAYIYFDVTTPFDLSDYSSFSFTFTGDSGDSGYKPIRLYAGNSTTINGGDHGFGTGGTANDTMMVGMVDSGAVVGATVNRTIAIPSDVSKFGTVTRFAIQVHAPGDAVYTFSNLTFIKKSACEHNWTQNNPSVHLCDKCEATEAHDKDGSNGSCSKCSRSAFFSAIVPPSGASHWSNNLTQRGIGLAGTTTSALSTANVSSMTIVVESGTPILEGSSMQFIINSDSGWQSWPLTGFSGGKATLDMSSITVNWGTWAQLGVQYMNTTSEFTFSIELSNAEGVVVYNKTGLVSGGGTPTTPTVVTLDGTEKTVTFASMQASDATIAQGDNANITRVTQTGGYDAMTYFDILLDGDTKLTDYHNITFTYQGLSGDVGWKSVHVIAAPTATGIESEQNPVASVLLGSHPYSTNAATPISVSIPMTATAANGAITTIGTQKAIRIGIFIRAAATGDSGVAQLAGQPTVYTLSNIKFNLPPTCLCTYNEAHVCNISGGCGNPHPTAPDHNVGGTNGACSICGKTPIFSAVTHTGASQWNNTVTERGIALNGATISALASANVTSMSIIVESGDPVLTGMQFIINSAGVGGASGWQTAAITGFTSGKATLNLSDTPSGINWASTYVQLGVVYPNSTPFTFSIELSNAAGVVYSKTGLVSGGGVETPPPVAGTTYTWQQILENFFEIGRDHGAETTVVATVGGINVSGRIWNHQGIGINIAALRALSETDKTIEITVEVIGESEWGPRIDIWLGGDHNTGIHDNSDTKVTIPAARDISAGTAHRLVVNGSNTATFTITGIKVGGLSIVKPDQIGAEPCTNHNYGPHGRCNVCNDPCGHPRWADSKCTVCAMPCTHTGFWAEGKCSRCNDQCSHPGWEFNDEATHICITCDVKQAHAFPTGGGECSANGCFANNSSGSVVVVYTPCGMCGVVGPWRWHNINPDVHWAANCNCQGYESHSYDANGRCKCGWITATLPSPCGMCGVVGQWRWGGDENSHWAHNCSCPGNAPHWYDANGRCICGRTGTPSPPRSACGICGVVGPWRWGGDENSHWADNCNCTGNEPHSFNASGRCRCGATRLTAAQESYLEENFMDDEALIDAILAAIEAGEVPVIDLTNAGSVTIISANVLLEIARLGVDVDVVLPSGFVFTIIASSITADVGSFDLNIEVLVKHEDVQLETIGGGKVDVSANSLVFKPNFHGEFGFVLVFHVTADQIEHAGIDLDTIGHYHVCAVGNITEMDEPTVNADGSVNFPMSHASFHVLSGDPPVTLEVGTGVITTEAPAQTVTGGEQNNTPAPAAPGAPIQDIAQQAANWFLIIAISAVAILAAGGVIFILIRRNSNTRRAG